MSDFYKQQAISNKGDIVSMEEFKGKTVLIVNTASKCGFTPQYEGLEKLYKLYGSNDFTILGFPCDQFNNQEPGDDAEIEQFCKLNYGISFPLFQKIEVNGPNTHPLFNYLKSAMPGIMGTNVKWNFTKFLIGPDGEPIKRFAPTTEPESIEPYIKKLSDK